MKTSLSSFLYINFTLEEAIEHTALAGFDGIDIWGGRPHAYPGDIFEHDIHQLKALINNLGLEVASFIPAQLQSHFSLCHPEASVRSDSIAYLRTCVETAARLGAPIISVAPGHTLHNQDLDAGWETLAESLDQICEFASRYEVLIAIEPSDPYDSDLINTSIQALDLIDEIACDNLGVIFDTGHVLVANEDISAAISNLGDRLFHVHLSDNVGERDQHLIPGQGIFDFQALVHALRLALYEGFLTAEPGWDYTLNPDSAASASQDFIQSLI